MELKEYIDGARRTESSLLPLSEAVVNLGLTNRMYHGIVGIVTEVGEIVEAYEKDQIVELPKVIANILIKKGRAEEIK